MANEYAVKRIALLAAVSGLALLLALDRLSEPSEISIAEAGAYAEKKVEIPGKVESAFMQGNILRFQLNDGTGKISAFIFSPREEQRLLVQKNSFIKIFGKIRVDKNKAEITVERVEQW